MPRRPLGKTGLKLTELTLGTWGLSGDGYGPVEESEQARVIERALDMGIHTIETADAYGAGRMERLIGEVLARRADVADGVVIVTKGGTDRTTSPPRKRFDGEYIRASVERSLRRLGRDRIDVYLLHSPRADVFASSETVDALLDLKRQGKIGHWGVSAGDVAVGRTALRRGAEAIEVAYNLLHGTHLHRLAGEIMVSRARGVLARSTLAYGLLSGHWRVDRDFAQGDHRGDRWSKPGRASGGIEQIASLRFLLNRDVLTMRAAAVRFVPLQPARDDGAVLGTALGRCRPRSWCARWARARSTFATPTSRASRTRST